MRHYLYLLIFSLLTFVSCETELPEGDWSKEPPTPSVTYQLSIDKTIIVAKTEGSSEAFNIMSDDSWTVSASEAWVKVSDATGNGNKTITATVEANTSKETRTATLTITGKNSGVKHTITVSQEGKVFTLSVDKTSISVGSSGSTETFNITGDDSWTATSDVSWATLSATSDSGDKTITVSISLNSTTAERTGKITVKGSNSSIEKTITVTQQGKSSMNLNGHEYVDLGLPSGLLWATCNVGANKPEDYGDYFAWGATTPQSVYDWVNTPYQTQNTTDNNKIKFTKYLGSTTSSYKDSSAKDSDALKIVLDPEDDAAHVNWGGSWRMPTRSEQDELRDKNNCTWTWTTLNGVNGYIVTSKKNGESLFLPASSLSNGSSFGDAGMHGEYWSSSLLTDYPNCASCFCFSSSRMEWVRYARVFDNSVRPVCHFPE